MIRKVFVLAAALMLSSAAHAADVYERGGYKDEPPYRPAISWAGFYFGGHVGATLADEVQEEAANLTAGAEIDSALVAGIHVGYNRQTPTNWVYGLEADIDIINDDFDFDGRSFDITEYLASLRGRLGIASGSSLLYATAGIAFLGYDKDIDDLFADGELGLDDPVVGLVVGAGIEYKFSANLSAGLEGLYYNFSSDTNQEDIDLERNLWTARARLTYHFNRDYAEPLK